MGLKWTKVNQHLMLTDRHGKYDYRIRNVGSPTTPMFTVIEENRVSRKTRAEDVAGIAEGQAIAEQWACERQ